MGNNLVAELEQVRALSLKSIRKDKNRKARHARWRAMAFPPLVEITGYARHVPTVHNTPPAADVAWLAETLGLCLKSAYDAISAGNIPPSCYYWVGRRLKVRTHQVLRWVTDGMPGFYDGRPGDRDKEEACGRR